MRPFLSSLTLLTLLFASPGVAAAQSAEDEVHAVVERLFDGMRKGDSTQVHSVFHPEARMLSVNMREDSPTLQRGDVDAFVEAVGTPREEVWDEKIWEVEIRIDGSLATAWMNYAFYLDGERSHCGVNAFQLFQGEEGWQIIQLTDTRRHEPCEEPPEQ